MAKAKPRTLPLWEDSNSTLNTLESQDSTFHEVLGQKPLRQVVESLAIPLEQYPKICGIDEAGRGCVAGSLFVCGVVLNNPPQTLLSQLKDSKTLSQKTRDFLAKEIKQYAHFHLVQKSAQAIDTQGLSVCLRDSLLEILAHLSAPFYCFDGPCSFGIQTLKTLVKGDSKLHAISAASILAKSAKDSEMQTLHTQFPQYDFAHNKGYCTQAHLNAISQNGLCAIHRKTYRLKALSQTPTLF